MNEGDRLKAEGIAEVSAAPEGAPWRAVAQARLRELAASGKPFTSEDITDVAGQPGHPNAVGALLSGGARSGIIERTGYVKALRPNQHSAMISEWRGISGRMTITSTITMPAEGRPVIEAQEVSPYREGTSRVAASRWECSGCGETSPVEPPLATLDDRYRRGRCPSCGKNTQHRRRG